MKISLEISGCPLEHLSKMKIGTKLFKLRESLNFTQEELAKALGVAGKLTIHRWETGKRDPLETIRRLVLLLNDLPKEKALEFLSKLESYGKR